MGPNPEGPAIVQRSPSSLEIVNCLRMTEGRQLSRDEV